jgi:serine protease Do
VAIGSPFGLNRTVTSGIISAKGRGKVGLIDIEDFIQTDASINPGSSGGPLLNAQGEVIGLNTAIFSEGGGSVGVGFAIPSSIVKDVSDELIAHGHVSRGWLGLSAQDLDPDLARFFKVPGDVSAPSGALVSEVYPESPASHSPIRPGDVVLKYDHHSIDNASTLRGLVGKTPAGKQVAIDFLHDGSPEHTDVLVGQQPLDPVAEMQMVEQQQMAGQAAMSRPPVIPGYGMTVENVPVEINRALKIPDGSGALVVSVRPDSPAFESGMEPGDIVLQVGAQNVRGAQDFKRVSDETQKQDAGRPSVLYVQRGPIEKIFVPMKYAD